MNTVQRLAQALRHETRATRVLVLLAAVVLSGCGTGTVDLVDSSTELQAVEDQCDGEEGDPGWAFVYTADGGRTLIVDTEGEEDFAGATIEQVACVLVELGVPTSVTTRMQNTRALDGQQTASWDGYTVTWSYHPDTGLDLIIEES
jgi:hypothetical protein